MSPENPGEGGHFFWQLLEFLKIPLDMAANNMEINRLLANVDSALDRRSRTRELGFRRMREAQESLPAAQNIQEETTVTLTERKLRVRKPRKAIMEMIPLPLPFQECVV